MFIIGPDGIVQDCEAGADQKLAEVLPEKIGKLLAGENIYEKPLKEYEDQLKQYAKMLETPPEGEPAAGEPVVTELKLPEAKTAPRSEPATMKLTPLWKCAEVKSPGNILVLGGDKRPGAAGRGRGLEIPGRGRAGRQAHRPAQAESRRQGSDRQPALGRRGRRQSLPGRLHGHAATLPLLDENWKLVANYPEDALKKPHSGIADVELGDLDGDGKLKMYVSYLGVVGVQAVSLDGKRLWANRSMSNVGGMAIGGPGREGTPQPVLHQRHRLDRGPGRRRTAPRGD